MLPFQPHEVEVYLKVLLHQIRTEHKPTLRIIEAVPIDKGDYRPDPGCMTALDLAWHLAAAEMFFLGGALTGEFPSGDGKRPESIQSSADVASWYRERFPKVFERLQTLTSEQLLKPIPFHEYTFPAIGYLQIAVNHSIHHRGQLSVYLRPMGAKVPSMHGPSGDEAAEAARQS